MADSPEVAERRARARRTALLFGAIAVGIFLMFLVVRSIS